MPVYEYVRQVGDEEVKEHVLALDEANARAWLDAEYPGEDIIPFQIATALEITQAQLDEIAALFPPDPELTQLVRADDGRWDPVFN